MKGLEKILPFCWIVGPLTLWTAEKIMTCLAKTVSLLLAKIMPEPK